MVDLATDKRFERLLAARGKPVSERVEASGMRRDTQRARREALERLRAARAEFAKRHASP